MRIAQRVWLAAVIAAVPWAVPSEAKQPLDHDAYDIWMVISGERISDDGRWVLYSLSPQDGDSVLKVKAVGEETEYEIPRGTGGRFTSDGGFVVFTIRPAQEEVRQAKREEKKTDEQPKNGVGILNLSTGEVEEIERTKSFRVPDEGGPWVAWLHEKPLKKDEQKAEEESEEEASEEEPAEEPEEPSQEETPEDKQAKEKRDKKPEGTELVARNLADGTEHRFDNVTEYGFSKDGSLLLLAASNKDGDADGAFAFDTGAGTMRELLRGEGIYKSIVSDEEATQAAFLANRDDYAAEDPAFTLYHWVRGEDEARAVAGIGSEGIPGGWWVSEHRRPSFSKNGGRIFFGSAPRPEPEPDPDEKPLKDEEVRLDVWNWRDPLLQPMQLRRLDDEKKRTYLAGVDVDSGEIVQLATEAIPEADVANEGDGLWALGESTLAYRQLISWDFPSYRDAYLIDSRTGDSSRILDGVQASVSMSPEGKYVYWWDGESLAWFAMDTADRKVVKLTEGIPHAFEDELNDRPMRPGAYGSAGWLEDDAGILLYDRHDIWLCDPRGIDAPRSITGERGRKEDWRFRYVDLDDENEAIARDEPLLLAVFDYRTRAGGFYQARVDEAGSMRPLLMMDKRFGTPRKARNAETLLYTRESFVDFPDLYASPVDFSRTERISEANPQQPEYRWGTAELVSWRSAAGEELEGIVYKPEEFNAAAAHPMMVYFYERLSQNLNAYHAPRAERASINISFFVSRGYVVFVPDIPYKEGYPGESALQAVVPGVLSVIAKGYVDPDRIGIQGHSWGGYQTAYIITRTNMFAAAEAGAPVSNMTSAYGGIRWETGMSRMFQYEKTQSRIGGTLWERPLHYIENSPLFWADRVETPLLMLHNDEDGAVPWYQGIEMFVALRRLEKPVWMLNYNGEAHGLTKYHNRKDWTIRMQQFFDHYLKGAPMPVWMADGVPAVEKGRTLGLEPADGTEGP